MNRNISVSTDVYAAIWARREAGENDENAILARVLCCVETPNATPAVETTAASAIGVYDARNGVAFPEGFEIFRRYKGQEFTAIASNAHWHRADNGQAYPTLNQLNASIAAGSENVWNGNWKYKKSDGSIRPIADLRR